MNAAPDAPPLIVRLRCRSCPNDNPRAFAREDPSTRRTTPELLIGGRWISDSGALPAHAEAVVVCLACGARDPEAEVFEAPPNAADAERNRHLIVEALAESLRLSERARHRAATPHSIGPDIALRQLRDIYDRIIHLLAEGAERGDSHQALRAANARIGKLHEDARRDCRRLLRRRRAGGKGP